MSSFICTNPFILKLLLKIHKVISIAGTIEEYKASMEPAEFEEMKAKMESEKEMFQNTGMQFFLMFLTVFIIGLIVSIVSAIILKTNPKKEFGT